MILISLLGREARQYLDALDNVTWKSDEELHQLVEDMAQHGVPVPQVVAMLNRLARETNKKRAGEKLKAINMILRKGDPDQVNPALMKAIPGIPDRASRRVAFDVLQEIADETSEKGLADLLRHKEDSIRDEAERVLIARNSPSVTPYLLEIGSKKAGWEDRRNILRVLGQVAGENALHCFQIALEYGRNEDLPATVAIITRLGSPNAAKIMADAAATTDSPMAKAHLAEGLGKIQCEASAQGLVRLAQDDNDRVQIAALGGLENQPTRHIVQTIKPLLEHKKEAVRIKAIRVLSNAENESAIEPLVSALKDDALLVRQEAMSALTALSDSGKVPLGKLLIGLMQEKDVNVRRSASEVLNKVKDRSVINELLGYLRDEDWWVRETIAETLGEIGGEEVIDTMIDFLGDKDANVRRYAVEILAQNKAVKAFKPLTQLLKDPDWWIREKVVEALGQIGDQKAIPLLIKLLSVPELRWAGVIALGELKAEQGTDALIKLFETEDTREGKLEIMDALQKIKGKKVIALMEHLIGDENKSIRLKARDFLNSLNRDVSKAEGAHLKRQQSRPLTRLDELLVAAREAGATDLFLAAEQKPMMKKHGDVLDLMDEPIPDEELLVMLIDILDEERERIYNETHDLDCAYETPLGDRFRVNMYRYRLGAAAVFRCIPDKVPSIDELGYPPLLKKLAHIHQGIVLFTGPAACGKTTTMATMVNHANHHRQDHILCLEDPIEYVHEHRECLVNQREVHTHTKSFANALRAALREDPDVIMVGELRDLETISMAITAAETGHLVFGSLHTTSAVNTLTRIIDAYPAGQQSQIRTMLSESVKAIISQQLVRRKDGGMVGALEILVHTPSLSKQIRDGKMEQVYSTILTGRSRGMQTMDQALLDLVNKGIVDGREAYRKAFNKKDFEHFVAGEIAPEPTADGAPAAKNG